MYALVAEMGKIDMRKRLNLNWRNLLRLSFTLNHCLRFRKELRGRTSTRVVTDAPCVDVHINEPSTLTGNIHPNA
jgi:hypothetical protein